MMRMKKTIIVTLALLFALPLTLRGQHVSIGTNAIEWANLGTINGEAGVSVSQHFSIHLGARYNNWTFRKGSPEDRFTDPEGDSEKQFQNRKQAYSVSLRWWPWYVYSGWWVYAKGQYMEYNRGGIFKHEAEEADAYGAGLGVGYTYMLSANWNLEFGIGGWAGQKKYKTYRCTNCGTVVDEGKKFFVMPDDVFVSLIYVF